MKCFFGRALSALLISACCAGSAIAVESQQGGYDIQFASYGERLAGLEAELASYKDGDGACQSCGTGKGDGACDRSWYFMAEVPWLQVNDAGIAVPGLPVMTPHFGQALGIRVVAGTQRCDGLGFRTTAFHFEDTAGNGMLGPIGLDSQVEVYAVDLELTHQGQFCGWDIVTTGGVRIGGLDQELHVDAFGNTIDLSRDFDGAGLTAGVELLRPIGSTRLSAYSSFNASLLFGDADIDVLATGPSVPTINASVATIPNQTVAIWEMQLGLQYDREMRYGTGFVRLGVEAQLWEQPPVVLGLADDNIGFFGPTFAVGLAR